MANCNLKAYGSQADENWFPVFIDIINIDVLPFGGNLCYELNNPIDEWTPFILRWPLNELSTEKIIELAGYQSVLLSRPTIIIFHLYRFPRFSQLRKFNRVSLRGCDGNCSYQHIFPHWEMWVQWICHDTKIHFSHFWFDGTFHQLYIRNHGWRKKCNEFLDLL